MAALASRIAGLDDIPALQGVMAAAIGELQKGFLTPQQIEASRMIMGAGQPTGGRRDLFRR